MNDVNKLVAADFSEVECRILADPEFFSDLDKIERALAACRTPGERALFKMAITLQAYSGAYGWARDLRRDVLARAFREIKPEPEAAAPSAPAAWPLQGSTISAVLSGAIDAVTSGTCTQMQAHVLLEQLRADIRHIGELEAVRDEMIRQNEILRSSRDDYKKIADGRGAQLDEADKKIVLLQDTVIAERARTAVFEGTRVKALELQLRVHQDRNVLCADHRDKQTECPACLLETERRLRKSETDVLRQSNKELADKLLELMDRKDKK